ncbi:hypothetical protein [Marimonas arenosa]|uniref:Uncharacterized protein n=1 Tax=Marimonas arenosa TaxID=1795305 RepID=A0AAE3WAG8_9RHOB|nr:hypothetical protein [Marimonas arenosa]MDQ2088920.1 hypothetical protein [Marimonas arenosa]
MGKTRRYIPILGVPAILVAVSGVLAQGDQFDFMPPGGRGALLDLLGQVDAETLAEVAAWDKSAEDWQAWALLQESELDEKAIVTFAGYAELNLPVSEDVLQALAESGDAALLPQDGKDLAIAQCQYCHSLFSGYLMHDRDEIGWKSTFKSPFHLEIPMTEVERDTFARYSAINMPLRFDDVPPELRF